MNVTNQTSVILSTLLANKAATTSRTTYRYTTAHTTVAPRSNNTIGTIMGYVFGMLLILCLCGGGGVYVKYK